ncbi:MAG: hypothetical protein ACRCV0_02590 [Brevinema sp.]
MLDLYNDGTLYSYYNGVNSNPKNTLKYYKLIEWYYQGKESELTDLDWKDVNGIDISLEYQRLIKSITNIDTAVSVAVQLMEKNAFQGTDHRDSNALDFDDTETAFEAEKIARIKRHQTYSKKTLPKDPKHVHILFN